MVTSTSAEMGLRPIVVLNKIDRPHAAPDRALNLTFDLFMELGANDEQLDFPYIYASGFSGYAIKNLDDEKKDRKLGELNDQVIRHQAALSELRAEKAHLEEERRRERVLPLKLIVPPWLRTIPGTPPSG